MVSVPLWSPADGFVPSPVGSSVVPPAPEGGMCVVASARLSSAAEACGDGPSRGCAGCTTGEGEEAGVRLAEEEGVSAAKRTSETMALLKDALHDAAEETGSKGLALHLKVPSISLIPTATYRSGGAAAHDARGRTVAIS